MTTNEQPRGSYPYPVHYLPNGYRCIKVYVPDDDIYQQDFLAGYEYFCTWLAWGRDAQHKAKAIAAKWRIGFDRVITEIESGTNCMTTFTGLRQNPANPCQLQYSADNGISWVTFADLSNCAGSGGSGALAGVTNLHIENNVIVGTDQCGDTVPLGQANDPTTSARFTPAYPDEPTNGQCLSGANAAEYIEDQIHKWSDIRLNVIGYVQQVINIAQGFFLLFSEVAWLDILWEILDEIAEFTEDHDDDLLTLSLKADYAALFPQYYNPDGTMSQTRYAELLTRLETTLPTPPTWTAEQEYHFKLYRIVKSIGAVGMSRLAKAAGITDAVCTGAEWSVLFDLTKSPIAFPVLYGQYVQGTGLRTTYHTDAGDSFRQAEISINHADYELTKIELTYFAEQGVNDFGSNDSVYARIWYTSNANDHIIIEDDPILEGVHSLTWIKTTETNTVSGITLVVGHGNTEVDPGGLGIIQKIRLSGTGTNPFGQ